ncbi:MAG TPA: hypothetical protein VF752_02615 [Thermoleophilaceae bacterium]
MTTTPMHEAAELKMRELLEDNDLPQPDEIEHEETSIVLTWHESKLVVMVDLTDAEDD